MEEDPSIPGSEQDPLEELLVRHGRAQLRASVQDCPREAWVLERLASAPLYEDDEQLAGHLASCAVCRELALACREAEAEQRGRAAAPVPPRIRAAVRAALPGEQARRRPALGLSRTWVRLGTAAALAAGLLAVLQIPASPRGLFDGVVVRQYALAAGSGASETRPSGKRFWLRARLRAPSRVYFLVAYTLGDEWSTRWIEPPNGPSAEPRAHQLGALDLLGGVPAGTLEAKGILLAVPEPLGERELASLLESARRADFAAAQSDLEALARASRGTVWCKRLAPAGDDAPEDLRIMARRLLESPDSSALSGWVAAHPRQAAAAVAAILEEELLRPAIDPDSQGFQRAERLAAEHLRASGESALRERVAACRRLARSPEDLERRLALDQAIRRDLPIHDDNLGLFRVFPSYPENARHYRDRAEEYRALDDAWGEIECLLRRACFDEETLRPALLAQALERSRAASYPRGEGLALFHIAQQSMGGPVRENRAAALAAWDALAEIQCWEPAAVAKSNLAFKLIQNGVLGEAFLQLEEAARTQRRCGLEVGEALTLVKLSQAHTYVGRSEDALPLALRAIRLLEAHPGSTPMEQAITVRAQGRAYWYAALSALGMDEPERVLELASRGEEVLAVLREEERDPDGLSRLGDAAAQALIRLGRFEEARDRARAAADLATIEWRKAQARATQGRALRQLGDLDEALEKLAQARVPIATVVDDRLTLAAILEEIAAVHEQKGDLAAARTAREEWLRTVESVLGDEALTGVDAAFLRERFRSGLEASLELLWKQGRTRDSEGTGLAMRILEAARPSPQAPDPAASLDALQAALGQGEVWIEPFLGRERSFALVATPSGAELSVIDATRRELADRFRALRQAVAGARPVEEIERLGRECHAAVLAPLGGEVLRSACVLFSPDPGEDAPLLDAFVVDGGSTGEDLPRYLVLERAVALVPSAGTLLELRGRLREPPPLDFLGLFEPPAATAGAGRSLDASSEVEALAGLFPPARARIRPVDPRGPAGAGADPASSFRFVHCLAGAFELGLPESVLRDSSADGELLQVFEVSALGPLRADVVFLSPGGSQPGAPEWPQGVEEFPQALLAAGAGAVVIAPRADTRAAREELLVRFYRELVGPVPRAEALRRAKLALLQGLAAPEWRHPRHWAAVTLVGDPR